MNNCIAFLKCCGLFAMFAGVVGGLGFLWTAVCVLILKKWSVAGKLAAVGLCAIGLGIVTSRVLNSSVASTYDVLIPGPLKGWLWIIGIAVLLVAVGFTLISCFLPTIIAFKARKKNRKLVMWWNILLGWFPLGWYLALYESLKDDNGTKPGSK